MAKHQSKKTIDISDLNIKQAEKVADQVGNKVRVICDKAVEKANKILNAYGMKAQMQIAILGINEDSKEE